MRFSIPLALTLLLAGLCTACASIVQPTDIRSFVRYTIRISQADKSGKLLPLSDTLLDIGPGSDYDACLDENGDLRPLDDQLNVDGSVRKACRELSLHIHPESSSADGPPGSVHVHLSPSPQDDSSNTPQDVSGVLKPDSGQPFTIQAAGFSVDISAAFIREHREDHPLKDDAERLNREVLPIFGTSP